VKCLEDGFNWIEFADHVGMSVAVWTVNTDDKQAIRNAQLLREHGAKHFISDTPIALKNLL
jgi:glycerophosphoryl diester phosphodiesterase